MPYAIREIEITEPLPPLALSEEEGGVAVVVRHRGRPISFWMSAHPPGTTLDPEGLARRLYTDVGPKLLAERMRAEVAVEGEAPAPERFPALTVAICTKDRAPMLARCLDALLALELPPSVEVLVVDNAPCDRQTHALVQARPRARYVCEPKAGLDFARNRAIEEAAGEWLAFLDDDVVVDAGWLGGLREAWAEHPDAAAFTGLVLPYELDTEAQVVFERRGGFRQGFDKERHGQHRPGDPLYPCGAGVFGTGANMAFRRDVLQRLGGFDEALDAGAALPGGGDLDMFYRVVRAGYPLVYEPAYAVYHQHRRTMKALRRQYAQSWGLGLMAFIVKSYRTDAAYRPQIRRFVERWLAHQAKRLVASLVGGASASPRTVAGELRGGLAGLLGGYDRSVRRVEKIRRTA